MKKTILSLGTICIIFFMTAFTSYAEISGCYNTQSGILRILVPSSSACRPGETLIQLAGQSEIPRIVHGTVDSDGTTILSGTGFSVAPSSGIFVSSTTITFDPPFSQRPDCTVSSGEGFYYCSGTWVEDPPSLQVYCVSPEPVFLDGYDIDGPAGLFQVVLNVVFRVSLGPYSFVCVQD